ncbi:MAG: N-acetylneuraminate synthase [Pelotomaculum sp.]
MKSKPTTYIIAEAGVNHNGSLSMAKQLVNIAAEAGADAVKFQTFRTEELVSKTAPKAAYQQQTTSKFESQYAMLKKLELTEADHNELVSYCADKNIDFLSTPFDAPSVDLLADILGIRRIKISSGEITNAPLLLKIASTQKEVILSTGMSTLGEIERALEVLAFGYICNDEQTPSVEAFRQAYLCATGQEILQEKVTLLHCTTEYPAPFKEVNLRAMDTLQQAFGLPVGYSDHTPGIAVPIAAVARGAVMIEKHFTLDRNLPGPDHKASLEPEELKQMVQSIRQVEQALGTNRKMPTVSELANRTTARKSLVALKEIKCGEEYTVDNLGAKRPGNGLSPFYYWKMLGRRAARDYQIDELVEL